MEEHNFALVETQGEKPVIKDGPWPTIPERVWFGREDYIDRPAPGATHPNCEGIIFAQIIDTCTPTDVSHIQTKVSLNLVGHVLTITREFRPHT